MDDKQLFFSIIVPTYDRPRQLAACLQALSRLDYPAERFQVILVDDSSKTSPEAIMVPFQDRLNVTLLTQPHAGPAAARNTGAARAKGEFLAFTDDDCTPTPDWLQSLAVRFAETPDCAIGGRTLNALADNLYSTASQLLIDYLFGYYHADSSEASFFTSNNLAMPADRFYMIGGFDTTFPRAAAEDRELCDRWLRHGYRMMYAPEVLVYHLHALTFRTFWRQHFNYGRGASHFHRLRVRRGQDRIRLEPLSFYLNMLPYFFSQVRRPRALLLVKLLVMSQVANIAGFLWEEMK